MKNMYKRLFHLIVPLSIFYSCHSYNSHQTEIPVIDVTQTYPVKEIELTDIADINYLKLKIDEAYLFSQAPTQITENYILIVDRQKRDVIFYDRKGNPINVFNIGGNGPDEFSWISMVVYDEANDELFVLGDQTKFKVYNKDGLFKRDLKIENSYLQLQNFNDQWLLSHIYKEEDSSAFVFINKQNGMIEKEIAFPYEKRLEPKAVFKRGDMIGGVGTEKFYSVKHKEGFILNEYSIDTVFLLSPEFKLIPKIVRTPESQHMNPLTYLNSMLDTKDYYFFSHVKLEFDLEKRIRPPLTHIGMNKKTGELFTQKIKFKDYKDKEILLGPSTIEISNDPDVGILTLSVEELTDAYEQDLLNGELKKIASQLDVEDNDILMFIRFK